jgi:capsular polysaccharide biosynthesis protein
MEIRNYFRTIGRFIWWLVVPVVVVMIITLVVSIIYEQSYEAPLAFSVNRKTQEDTTNDYQFDSYYAIQANNILGTQFSEWLKSNWLISEIYQRAGLQEENSILEKEWKVAYTSPQNIELLFRGRDKNRVESLANAATSVVNDEKETFSGTGDKVIGTVGIPSNFVVVTKRTSMPLNLLVGLVVGIILGLIFVYFKAIFTPNNKKT